MNKLIVVAALTLGPLGVQAGDFALGTGLGTPGANLNLTYGLSETLNLRGVVNFYSTDFDETTDGIDYDLDLDLQSAGALLDWHPGGGAFRVTGGLFANGNDVSGVGRGASGTFVEYGDLVVPADELGTVNAELDLDGVAPYLGIGFGNAVREAGFSFSLDVGVYFQGEPDVTLTTPDVDPAFAAIVEAERAQAEADLEDELDILELYPYVSIGLAYRF
jgi:hypothetical protein